MPKYTDRFGLSILGPGDSLQNDGFKFSDADRRFLDRLLKYGAEQHHHTGETPVDRTPVLAPTVTLVPNQGAMPANARYYYRFTVVDDVGNESAPSPMMSVDMPPAVSIPTAPALNYISGSGLLQPGTYSYAISAYTVSSTLETKIKGPVTLTLPPTSGSNNTITLALPALPVGATGLNIYRKRPNGLHFLFLAAVDSPTNEQVWNDDGTIEADCDRSLPPTNRTASSSGAQVEFPPSITMSGEWSWRIYRTPDPNSWSRSFLTEVVPEGDPFVTPLTYLDIGSGTTLGAPPTKNQVVGSPPKIDLTDGAEVTGVLPPGMVTVPQLVTFVHPGPVTVQPGTFRWTSEYDQAEIVSCRAYLGIGSVPDSQSVIVDVLHAPAGTDTFTSVFERTGDRPRIPIGQMVGSAVVPTVAPLVLQKGDQLSVDTIQHGGGLPRTDSDLTVNVLLLTQTGSLTSTYVFPEAP